MTAEPTTPEGPGGAGISLTHEPDEPHVPARGLIPLGKADAESCADGVCEIPARD